MRSDVVVVVVCGVFAVASGCAPPQPPATDLLHVQGRLSGPAGAVDVDFSDERSVGEWWPCDARLTARGCVDDRFHVGVFLGLPGHDEFADVGGGACVDEVDGQRQASGAYEILRRLFFDGHDAEVGRDVSVFVLVGSDADENGVPTLSDPDEVKGVTQVTSGTLDMSTLEDFDAPFAMRLQGQGDDGDVLIEFRATMSVPDAVPPLPPSSTCEPRPDDDA
jgi:hypothetical protein